MLHNLRDVVQREQMTHFYLHNRYYSCSYGSTIHQRKGSYSLSLPHTMFPTCKTLDICWLGSWSVVSWITDIFLEDIKCSASCSVCKIRNELGTIVYNCDIDAHISVIYYHHLSTFQISVHNTFGVQNVNAECSLVTICNVPCSQSSFTLWSIKNVQEFQYSCAGKTLLFLPTKRFEERDPKCSHTEYFESIQMCV